MEGAPELVDDLLRVGADEAMVGSDGSTAADLVGVLPWRESSDIEENVERVRKLLAGGPIERAWRRRRLSLLCGARHRRERQRGPGIADLQEGTGPYDANGRRKAEGKADDGWARVGAWVEALGLGQKKGFNSHDRRVPLKQQMRNRLELKVTHRATYPLLVSFPPVIFDGVSRSRHHWRTGPADFASRGRSGLFFVVGSKGFQQ